MNSDHEIAILESMFRYNTVLGIAMTRPMKMALDELARIERTKVSAMVRGMFVDYFSERYPEFIEIYKRCLVEQSARIKEGSVDDA